MSKSTAKKISFKGQAKCKKLDAFFPEEASPLSEKKEEWIILDFADKILVPAVLNILCLLLHPGTLALHRAK